MRTPGTLLRLASVIVLAGVGTAALSAALVPQAASLVTAHQETASIPELDPLAQRSVMYAADGSVMAVLKAEENRKPVKLAEIPQPVIDTVLAVEDAEFYQHRGVNARSLIRALLANVSAGGVTQGGSTITQQVVKNALLTPKRDANRKVKEAIYAIRLEREMTKDEILERYLNTVYFGNGAYGVQAAAELYFGIDVGGLGYPQAAFLTGLIRNPVGYDPFRFPARAVERRRISLNRLVDVGKITRDEADLIDAAPIPAAPMSSAIPVPPEDYFVEEVKQSLLDDVRLGDTAQERYNAVFKGGLQIYTTFEPRLQQLALQARNDQLPDTNGQFTVALVALDPQTGAVKAMVGGPGFENAKFNLATQGIRQPGSSMKTFVLVAALEAGVRPNDIFDGSSPCRFPLPGGQPDYVIRSAGGGVGQVSKMITASINCAFVRLGLIVGLDRVIDTARRMGVTSPLEPLPSMTIGSEEISPLEMASAYGVLAADGGRHPAYYVERVLDRDGEPIFLHDDSGAEQALDVGVARMATDMLTNVVKSGTGKRAALRDRPVAGKTGTSQDNADAWFVGYTPQLVTAVWMGAPVGTRSDAEHRRHQRDRRLVPGARLAPVHGARARRSAGHPIRRGSRASRAPPCAPLSSVCGVRLRPAGGRRLRSLRDDHDRAARRRRAAPRRAAPPRSLLSRPRPRSYATVPFLRCRPTTSSSTVDDSPSPARGAAHRPLRRPTRTRRWRPMRPSERATTLPSPLRYLCSRLRTPAHDHPRAVTLQSDLLALQHSDTHLDQLRHRRAHLPERADVHTLEATLADVEAELEKLSSRNTDLSRSQQRLEDEVASVEQKRAEVDRKLAGGTVPRELQALVDEGDSLRRRQRSLEDDLLEVMELAEPVAAQLAASEEQQRDLRGRLEVARTALTAAESTVDAELREAEAERAGAAAAIADPLLKEYERLRARLDGVAVSELVGTTCTGCHTTLAAMECERIRREPPDALVHCEPCGRIVVRP